MAQHQQQQQQQQQRRRSRSPAAPAIMLEGGWLSTFRARWVLGCVLMVSTLGLLNMANQVGNGDHHKELWGTTASRVAMEGEYSSLDESGDEAPKHIRAPVRRPLVLQEGFHLATTSVGLYAPEVRYLNVTERAPCEALPGLKWKWTKYDPETGKVASDTESESPTYYELDELWEREEFVRQERPGDLSLMKDSLTLPVPDMVIGVSNATAAVVRKNRRLGAKPRVAEPKSVNRRLHARRRLLLATYGDHNDTSTASTVHAYARRWGHDVLAVTGPALPTYSTFDGVRHVCAPASKEAHLRAQHLQLVRVALTRGAHYDHVMVVDPNALIYDLGRDVTKLLPSSKMIAAGAGLDTSAAAVWNLRHPLTHPVVVDWMTLVERAVRKDQLEDDIDVFARALVEAGELQSQVVELQNAFNGTVGTVVRTFHDEAAMKKAHEEVCRRFAPACE